MPDNSQPDRLDRVEAVIFDLTKRHEALTERHEALTMNLELTSRDIQDLRANVAELNAAVRQDAENIRALACIAEIRERRLSGLEGPR